MLTTKSLTAFWPVFMLSLALALPAGALTLGVDVDYEVYGTQPEPGDIITHGGPDWTSASVSYSPYPPQAFSQTVGEDFPGDDLLFPISSGSASGVVREDGLMWSSSNFYGGGGGDFLPSVGAASGHSGNGLPENVRFDSHVIWSNTFENTSGSALPYAFSFEVVGPTLVVEGTAGSEEEAGYEIDIQLDGTFVWRSEAVGSYNNDDGFTLAQSGTEIPLDSHGGGAWNFEDHEDTVNLGVIGAGESFTLDYTMNTYVSGSNGPIGMSARIGDPFDIESGRPPEGTIGSGSVNVVPEPATITLLGLGLLGAATRRRWRSHG